MSLITSMAEVEAPQRKYIETEAISNLSRTSFRNVLRDSLGSMSEDMDATFEEVAAKFSLPVNLIKTVAKAESNSSPKAASRAGAMGVMQLMSGIVKSLGVTDLYDARQNIMGDAKYLEENLDCLDDVSLALAAYNAGPNSVRKYRGTPSYSETQNYVKKVISYLNGTPAYVNRTVKTGAGRKTQGSLLTADNLPGFYSLPRYQGFSGYGNLYGLYGLYGGDSGLSAMSLTSGLNVSQDGDTVTMDRESFANLTQMLQLRMMVNAGREVGTVLIQEEQCQIVLKDCGRCMVYIPQGKRLSEARVIHTGGNVSPFFADYEPKDVRLRSRVDFYDEQAGLIATVCELVLHRNPSYPDMPESWMAECWVQDVLEVVQRQKDTRVKVRIEVWYSSIKHGTFHITIENISTGGIYMTTARPLNKNEAVTLTYCFRTLERRFEAATLWVRRIEGGRYGYGCRFVNSTNGAGAAIRSFVFKKLLERRQKREWG